MFCGKPKLPGFGSTTADTIIIILILQAETIPSSNYLLCCCSCFHPALVQTPFLLLVLYVLLCPHALPSFHFSVLSTHLLPSPTHKKVMRFCVYVYVDLLVYPCKFFRMHVSAISVSLFPLITAVNDNSPTSVFYIEICVCHYLKKMRVIFRMNVSSSLFMLLQIQINN